MTEQQLRAAVAEYDHIHAATMRAMDAAAKDFQEALK